MQQHWKWVSVRQGSVQDEEAPESAILDAGSTGDATGEVGPWHLDHTSLTAAFWNGVKAPKDAPNTSGKSLSESIIPKWSTVQPWSRIASANVSWTWQSSRSCPRASSWLSAIVFPNQSLEFMNEMSWEHWLLDLIHQSKVSSGPLFERNKGKKTLWCRRLFWSPQAFWLNSRNVKVSWTSAIMI